MRKEHEGTYQMLWDCPNCDTKKLLGLTHRHCPHCGAPQDPTARYFPSDDEKVAVEDHVYTGADWACAACDTPNSAAADFCQNCGNPKEGNREVKRRGDQLTGEGEAFSGDDARAARQELATRPSAPPPATATQTPARSRFVPFLIAFIAVTIVLVGLVVFWKKEAGVVVAGHTWSRSIQIETFEAVRDSAWRDQLPRGAYSVTCSRDIRSYKEVPDGEECHTRRIDKGDGSFDQVRECSPKYRKEPIYDQRCSFLVDRWVPSRKAEATGQSLEQARHWPEVRLSRTGTCKGCERQGPRSERYTVRYSDSKDPSNTYTCDFPEARWSQIPVGSRWTAKVGVVSGNLDCDELKPAP